ncbi:MAG: T9SS type A sorting domain-containing protein [Bacteroidetes bacterium]|nr:T9SS type A sorting domain-containing protein [Bacteroidota bacterium]
MTVDTATFTTFFINNQSVGIDDPTKIPGLSVYPNPANEFAQIWSPEIQLESVRIINSLGQEIRNENAGYTFKMNLSLSDLPAGFYLLEIIGSGIHRSTIRLMKQD